MATTPETLTVALVVPLQGPTGIYGPSCLACGELAVEQLNAAGGIGGRHVELLIVDAGRSPAAVAADVGDLVDAGVVDAIAGWHISAVRQAITARVGGKVMYAYAAMHEGSDDTPGVFMLGERPSNQLVPATDWMNAEWGVRRWAVVGNDYVFPRVTAATMRQSLRQAPPHRGASVVREHYVPLGTTDFSGVLRELENPGIDGVLMLLMGQDAVHFNRQFARAGLSEQLVRLSPAVEENTLMGAGASANHGLFAAAAFFDGLATSESTDLATAYYTRYGALAPALNAIGESCYEAIQFLARVADTCGDLSMSALANLQSGHFYESPRGLMRLVGNLMDQDVYVAAAQGMEFAVQAQIARAH